MVISQTQIEIVYFLVKKLKDLSEDWAITGSFGQALQGVSIEPKDIDIISTREGVLAIQAILEEFSLEKVEYKTSSTLRSYFGILEIFQHKIDFFGEIENFFPTKGWETHINWNRNIYKIKIGKTMVPVLKLEYEIEVYKKLSDIERVALLTNQVSRRENTKIDLLAT